MVTTIIYRNLLLNIQPKFNFWMSSLLIVIKISVIFSFILAESRLYFKANNFHFLSNPSILIMQKNESWMGFYTSHQHPQEVKVIFNKIVFIRRKYYIRNALRARKYVFETIVMYKLWYHGWNNHGIMVLMTHNLVINLQPIQPIKKFNSINQTFSDFFESNFFLWRVLIYNLEKWNFIFLQNENRIGAASRGLFLVFWSWLRIRWI